jgi:hypothetical protein
MPCARATSDYRAPAATCRTHSALKAGVYFLRGTGWPSISFLTDTDRGKSSLLSVRFYQTAPSHSIKASDCSSSN